MNTISAKVAIFSVSMLMGSLAIISAANASVVSFTKDADGVTVVLDRGVMKVKVCKDDIIEVKYTALAAFPSKTSFVVSNSWKTQPEFNVAETPDKILMTTNKLKIEVNKLTNAVTYFDVHDNLILGEDGANGTTMAAATVAGIKTYTCSTQFLSPADEALFGLGCHPEDSLSINYKGRNQDLAIKYMTGAIPVLLSNKGYGLMWDNYSASKFFGAEANNSKYAYISESGTMVDYYFFYGPEFDRIIALYREATGEAPMFAKWTFGLFQSQDRYQSQAEVLSVKDNYRKNHIPIDCIVQDWFYWEPNVIGSHVMFPATVSRPESDD